MNHQTNKELVTCTSIPLPRGKDYSRWIDHNSSQSERNAVSQLSRYLCREFSIGAISPHKGDWANERMEVLTVCVDIEKWRQRHLANTIEQLIGYAMFLYDMDQLELFQVYLLPSCRPDSHIHLRDFKKHVVDRYGTDPITAYPYIPARLARLFAIDKLNVHHDG